MIVITAPTGKIGHHVLGNVLAGDRPVRVIARDPAKLDAGVRERVEVVQGSHGDPQVVERAFKGADAVFWLVPPDPHAASVDEAYSGFSRPAAEAMRSQGVRQVVNVSALGRNTPHEGRAGYVTASLATNDLIAGTGVAFRALALPGFMENMLRQAQVVKEMGVFYDMISPGKKMPFVATRDIAAVAARLLLDPTWTGQEEVPVLGPEHLSYNDMAAVISEVLGTTVRYEQISGEAVKERYSDYASDPMIQGMLELLIAKENGLDDGVARTPQHAIDTPTTFRQWCEDVLKPVVQAP